MKKVKKVLLGEEFSKKRKNILVEFKEFISRGSVVDLAVGVIMGSSFTAIVNSLVKDLLMPIISLISKDGFEKMYIGIIKAGTATEDFTSSNGAFVKAGGQLYRAYITYGNFIQAIINFLLIALVIFTIVKIINMVHNKAEAVAKSIEAKKKAEEEKALEVVPAAPAEPVIPEDIKLLQEIRDSLQAIKNAQSKDE